MNQVIPAILSVCLVLEPPVGGAEAALADPVDETGAHQRAGDVAMLAGRHAEAYFEYAQAYRLSPYPVLDYETREFLRAKIFLALDRQYQASGDVRYLCESWRFHAQHVSVLRGAGASEQRLSAVDTVTQQLGRRITELRRRPAERACADRSARPQRIAGLSLLLGGMLAVGASAGAGALLAGDLRFARERRAAYAGHEPTPIEDSLDARLYERAQLHRDIAIAGAVLGGAFVLAGAALLRVSRRRPAGQVATMRPTFGPRVAGVTLRLDF